MHPHEFEQLAAGGVQLLTIPECCRILGVARSTFYELVAADRITLRRLGSAARVRSDELQQLIESLPAVTIAARMRR